MWRSVYVPSVDAGGRRGDARTGAAALRRRLGAPFWLVGLVLAAESLGMLIGDVPAGALLRRLDRKVTMLVGVAVVGVAVTAMAFVDGVVAVLLLRLGAGLGAALWGISRHAFLTTAVPPRNAVVRSPRSVGPSASACSQDRPSAAWWRPPGGFDAAFLTYGAIAAVAFTVCAIFLERAPSLERARGGHGGTIAAIASVVRDHGRVLAVAGAGQFMAQGDPLGAQDRSAARRCDGARAVRRTGRLDHLDRRGVRRGAVPGGRLGDGPLRPQTRHRAELPAAGARDGAGAADGRLRRARGGVRADRLRQRSQFGHDDDRRADLAPDDAVGEFIGVWRLLGDGGAMGGPVVVGALADLLTLPLATLAIASVGVGAALTFAYGVPETRRAPGGHG
jgi:hypothetical protein